MPFSAPSLRARCLERQYGPDTSALLERFGLLPPEAVRGLERLGLVRAGLAAACSFAALPPDLTATAVVGAPCLDHCEGDPRRLTVQAFADILYVVLTARDLGLPALVTLGTREEEEVAVRPELRSAPWRQIGALLKEWVEILCRTFGVQEVRIWQTHEPACDGALRALTRETLDLLPDRRLDGLYSLDGGSSFPAGSRAFSPYYAYFRRNVLNYLPELAAHGLRRPIERVVVAENLQQHKAVACARALAAQRTGRGEDAVLHLALLPTPSLGGRSRMSRAAEEDKIFVADSPASIAGKLSTAVETTRWYWRALVADPDGTPERTVAALAACRRALATQAERAVS